MNYPAYSEYRPSRIEWVKAIPAGWEETPVKVNFLMQLGKMLQTDPASLDDEESPYLKAMHVNWHGVTTDDLPKMWASPSDLKHYAVQNGDLLVCEGGEVGRSAILKGLKEPTIIQNALHRLRGTTRGEIRYFCYLLRNIADAGWFEILCNKATIAHLTGEKLGAIRMPVPSIREQQQIAVFLDWKTGQIDALIAKKKELLEKLKEQRLAVITQAVTQGLNPNAPKRDSGIPWLGQVPEHWEVRRLKFTACESLQYGANEAAELADPECPRYIRITDIKEDGTLHEDTFRSLPPDVAEPYLLEDGDLLLARSGATVGKSFQYLQTWGRAAYAGYLIRFRVDPKVLRARFGYYFLRSQFYWACINSSLIQATIQNFSAEKYAGINVPLPPLDEQETIVAELEKQKTKIDQLEEATVQAIARLTEYRTALITAATTGKIDVCNIKLGSEV